MNRLGLMLGVLVMSVHLLSAQFYAAKPLSAEQCSRADEVKLKFSKDKSGVFLVNYTAKKVRYFSENGRPRLTRFVKSKNQGWLSIDDGRWCGTGLFDATLDSCSYTYVETHHQSNFNLNRQPVDTIHTSLKYCVSVDSNEVCTEEVDVYMERYRVLPLQYYGYKAREWFHQQGGNLTFTKDEEKERLIQLFYEDIGW